MSLVPDGEYIEHIGQYHESRDLPTPTPWPRRAAPRAMDPPPPVPRGLPPELSTFDAALFRLLDGTLPRVKHALLHPVVGPTEVAELNRAILEMTDLWVAVLKALGTTPTDPED